MKETSVLHFWSYPQHKLTLSHFWTSLLWQVTNHCLQATFPEAAYKQCPVKILNSLLEPLNFPVGVWVLAFSFPPYSAFQWKCLIGLPPNLLWVLGAPFLPFTFPLRKVQGQGASWTSPIPLEQTDHSHAWGGGGGPRLWRAGPLKKILFPFPCWLGVLTEK